MNTRQRIILAVANGCQNTSEISRQLDMPRSTVGNYFYGSISLQMTNRFVNGNILQWQPGKTNTLHLANGVIRQRNAAGEVVGVYGKVELR